MIGPVQRVEAPVEAGVVEGAFPQRAAVGKPRRHDAQPGALLASWGRDLGTQRNRHFAGRHLSFAAVAIGDRPPPQCLYNGRARLRGAGGHRIASTAEHTWEIAHLMRKPYAASR